MRKRVGGLCVVVIILAAVLLGRILYIISNPQLAEVAVTQSTYVLEIAHTRGTIYDCNMRPLVGGRVQYRAAVKPSAEARNALCSSLNPEEYASIEANLNRRSPFVLSVSDGSADGYGIDVFRTEKRYGADTLAEHTVGFLDGSGVGVSGIESAFDDFLSGASGSLKAAYTVTARGNSIAGISPEISDTTFLSRSGVVLTLDADIQQSAESAAEKHIERGAVVVMEVSSGDIKAMVSVPSVDSAHISDYLDRDDSPLLNRAVSAYDVGSVFKLVVAAAAMEAGISSDFTYCCTGSVDVGNNCFHCSNRSGHGELDMYKALAVSCNTYFIELARTVGGEQIVACAEKLGFGHELTLCDDYRTIAGCLPDPEELKKPAAVANLGFGQGELMATPVHLASLLCTIANGGMYNSPNLFKGLVDRDLRFIRKNEAAKPKRVLSEEICDTLTLAMRMAVLDGTASVGDGDFAPAAAKTGTAQTGILRNGHKVLQAWYAGMFPYDDPKYVCVVLVEDGISGGSSAAPVFKDIVDSLYIRY